MQNKIYKLKTNFIIKLGLALHQCGASSYRIESHLKNLSRFWQINANFLITPTAFTYIFWVDPEEQYTHIVRVQPSDNNLGKLAIIDDIVEQVITEEITLEEAICSLKEAKKIQSFYGVKVAALGWCITGAGFAMLLSHSSFDIIASFIMSLLVYMLFELSKSSERLASVLEFIAPFLSGLFSTLIASAGFHINVPFVVLSSVIVFIPGLSITVALSEIVYKDLVSGTAKLVDATMLLFKLYFGALLGITLGHTIWLPEMVTIDSIYMLPDWKNWLAIIALSTGLIVAFNVHKKDIVWGILAGLVAYSVTSYTQQFLGITLGTFCGAFAVGLYSNGFAILKNKPASIVLLQGIVILVPGSRSYMDLNTLVSGELILNNLNDGNFVFMIFVALLAGMVLSNAVLPVNKSL